MKLLRSLLCVVTLALAGFTLSGVTGCAALSRVTHALTGSEAVLTLKIAGATADTVMKTAATAYHAGDLSAVQWLRIATLHDEKFLPLYRTELAALKAANQSDAPPSAALVAALGELLGAVPLPAR